VTEACGFISAEAVAACPYRRMTVTDPDKPSIDWKNNEPRWSDEAFATEDEARAAFASGRGW
jgi:hypothetical protein